MREAVKPLVEKLNHRQMRKLKKSRREVFEQLERGALKPLARGRYEFARWAQPQVHIDFIGLRALRLDLLAALEGGSRALESASC